MPSSPPPPPPPPRPTAKHFCQGVLISSPFTVPSLLVLSLLSLLSLLSFFFLLHNHQLSLHRHSSYGEPLAAPPVSSQGATGGKADHFRRFFLAGKDPRGGAAANDSISAHLRELTLGPHLAGTPSAISAASYVLQHFQNSGLRAQDSEYRVLLSYPVRSSLSLLVGGDVLRQLDLLEPAGGGVMRPYHGYSPSGSAAAPPVYANYGRREDYQRLAAMGVEVRGCVVVVRRGGGYRGAVVQRAAEHGGAAVVVFGAELGVERGTVLLGGPGDPLTPGWPAAADDSVERLGVNDGEVQRRFPAVPSLPVPAAAAEEILRAMGGPPLPEEWRRHLPRGMQVGGVGGVGGGSVLVNFTYEGVSEMETIRNVVGVITGELEPDRYVLLGNHRDAWTYGAVDPNSGTAALLEVARRLGLLLREGWRPRRTIVLCSWDAEEFGMIGSTEWVEEHLGLLQSKAVAYLNVDCAVQGTGFFASGTPQLDRLLVGVTKKVKDPDFDSMTVYQTWTEANGRAEIGRLGRADSDFTSFLHHAGVPSLDMYFGKDYPVYHTVFDSYDWMKKHGDPSFHRHVAVAEIWGLVALHLADDQIIPFDYLSYAARLQEHSSAMSSLLGDAVTMQPMNASLCELVASASEAKEEGQRLRAEEKVDAWGELRRRALNDRLMLAERGFLAAEGLRGRPWFKHLIYSPPADSESGLPFFPGIADALSEIPGAQGEEETWKAVQREVWRAARAVSRAAAALRELA